MERGHLGAQPRPRTRQQSMLSPEVGYSYRLDLTTIRGTCGRMTAATALKAAQYREKKAWFLGPRFATNADVAPTVGTWPYGLQRGLTSRISRALPTHLKLHFIHIASAACGC